MYKCIFFLEVIMLFYKIEYNYFFAICYRCIKHEEPTGYVHNPQGSATFGCVSRHGW